MASTDFEGVDELDRWKDRSKSQSTSLRLLRANSGSNYPTVAVRVYVDSKAIFNFQMLSFVLH
jgi:hypothetical protein